MRDAGCGAGRGGAGQGGGAQLEGKTQESMEAPAALPAPAPALLQLPGCVGRVDYTSRDTPRQDWACALGLGGWGCRGGARAREVRNPRHGDRSMSLDRELRRESRD